jgi:hypothetical protein
MNNQINRVPHYDGSFSTLPAGSEPLLGGMIPWLVWADLPELSTFENFIYIPNDFKLQLLSITRTCEIEQRRVGPG